MKLLHHVHDVFLPALSEQVRLSGDLMRKISKVAANIASLFRRSCVVRCQCSLPVAP